MKITLNELRQMVKSLLKEESNFENSEEFEFESLEPMPEMESNIISMIEKYKDTLNEALKLEDIEFIGYLKNKIAILDKMLRLITSGERFTKDFYDDRNEKYQTKKSIKDFFKKEISEKDLIDNLKSLFGSQYIDNIKSFINDIDTFETAEDAYQGFQDYI